ncbi:MAG: hypothetical protein J5849_02115, partial [Clostridia bacterium]|nr:hypothetical protein [Clostridia bacterium]
MPRDEPTVIGLESLYNPLMKDGFPRGSENGCGYRYLHTEDEAEADLRVKLLFFSAFSLLSGESFLLRIGHILDLRQAYLELDEGRDPADPPTEEEIARLTEPEIRYRHDPVHHFLTDSLAKKAGGKTGEAVYEKAKRERDSRKRRTEAGILLDPYRPEIEEKACVSPRFRPEPYEKPRLLLPPVKRLRGWVSLYTLQTASLSLDPGRAGGFLSDREKFWIRNMERHAFLETIASEMDRMLDQAGAYAPDPVRLILTDEGIGFGVWMAGGKEGIAARYYPKDAFSAGPACASPPWLFRAYGMSSLPEPKLRMFFLASLLSRIKALTGKDGERKRRIGGIDLSRTLADGKAAAELLLPPLSD